MPPFFRFFGHPKNHQKIDPSKNRLFWHFWGVLAILRPFFDDFGSILGSPGGHFSTFLAGEIFSRFFHRFLEKNQKLKKRKSSFRIVKYSVSWGSPCWKKCEGDLKKTSFFSSIFHPKSTKNRSKNRGKRRSQQKSMKKRSLGRLFGEKVDFWWFLGSQGGPKNG